VAERGLSARTQLHTSLPAHRPFGSEVAPIERLPERLLSSWQRSEQYGVSLEEIEPVFSGTFDQDSLFFECGQEVLTGLHRTLAAEPISLMLTDADGVVLSRMCDERTLLRQLDDVHLAPGFSYSERQAGTNGLGLALADRAPTLVRAEEHYVLSLCVYTCAAAPVLDPFTGRLEGSINLTTWSRASSDLLVALAQSAAGNTAALMLARSLGRQPRPTGHGAVFRVENPRLEPGCGTVESLSAAWTGPLARAAEELAAGHVVAAVGEPGSGRSTLVAQAARRTSAMTRIVAARPPAARDVEAWLSLCDSELQRPCTTLVLGDVGALPAWVAEQVRDLIVRARRDPTIETRVAVTAERVEEIPAPLAPLIDAIVGVAPLRDRPEDVLSIARHAANSGRGRNVEFSRAAEHALRDFGWPGNVEQLMRVVKDAARRTDFVDVHDLPPEVLVDLSHRLTRLQTLERDEIVRTLARPEITIRDAADRLGMSRATLYRRVAQYGVHVPRPKGLTGKSPMDG
jgi:sigma-54 dependent transcriptional regulator, acetoin dehydrogenase operon transcriptional activator AcoR